MLHKDDSGRTKPTGRPRKP